MPIISGIVWGRMNLILYSILFVLLITIVGVRIYRKKDSTSIAIVQISLGLVFLSLMDFTMNLIMQWDSNNNSLFVETPTPVIKKYKPETTVQTTFSDCLSKVSINESTICSTSFSFEISIDQLGFRNNPHATKDSCDAILIGDSFGFCASSKMDNTITELLYTKYNLNTYNLSVSGNGPWEQYHLLKSEIDNISLKRNAKVYWLIFSGNDLEGNFGPLNDLSSLNSVFSKAGRLKDAYYNLRKKSQVRNYINNIQKKID